MTRVLVVDDEPSLLENFRADLLRLKGGRWEMVFVGGSAEALQELEKSRFDVVVTDMRMPGMDGAALLERVKQEWPTTERIILFGHADREAIPHVLPVAHQFIGKPCDGQTICSVIERTSGTQAILANEELRAFVRKLRRLPSPPTTYFELRGASMDPSTGAADLARIVERDPAMSAKVLQLVNSAYFGLSRTFGSIATAVPYLGTEMLKGLALTVGIFGQVEGVTAEGFSIEDLRSQSCFTARVAKLLCTDTRQGEEAFTAGLLHDVGRLVLALAKPRDFLAASRAAAAKQQTLHEAERELFEFDHAAIGAFLLASWGLPETIVAATAFHHCPEKAHNPDFGPLAAVHIAEALIHGVIGGPEEELKRLQPGYVATLGIAELLPTWRELVARELCAVSAAA